MRREFSRNNKNWIEQKKVPVQQENSIPEYLYRIVSPQQWEESLRQNQLVNSSMDKDFIHLATEEQLARIALKNFE